MVPPRICLKSSPWSAKRKLIPQLKKVPMTFLSTVRAGWWNFLRLGAARHTTQTPERGITSAWKPTFLLLGQILANIGRFWPSLLSNKIIILLVANMGSHVHRSYVVDFGWGIKLVTLEVLGKVVRRDSCRLWQHTHVADLGPLNGDGLVCWELPA